MNSLLDSLYFNLVHINRMPFWIICLVWFWLRAMDHQLYAPLNHMSWDFYEALIIQISSWHHGKRICDRNYLATKQSISTFGEFGLSFVFWVVFSVFLVPYILFCIWNGVFGILWKFYPTHFRHDDRDKYEVIFFLLTYKIKLNTRRWLLNNLNLNGRIKLN